MEEALVDFLEQIGWGYAKMEKEGIISPVVSISCNYKKPTTFNDTVTVNVSVASVSLVKLTLSYTMTLHGNVVFTADSTHCVLANSKPVNIERQYPDFYKALIALKASDTEK